MSDEFAAEQRAYDSIWSYRIDEHCTWCGEPGHSERKCKFGEPESLFDRKAQAERSMESAWMFAKSYARHLGEPWNAEWADRFRRLAWESMCQALYWRGVVR